MLTDQKESGQERKHLSPGDGRSGPLQYILAILSVVAAGAICYPFSSSLGYQTISLILLLVVTLLPLKLGMGPVILGGTLSALIWNYFFIPPHFTFFIELPQDLLMFAMYFLTAGVAGVLTARVRAREKAVRLREERASALYRITRDLSLAPTQDDVVMAAVNNIGQQFEADVVVFLGKPEGNIFPSTHPASTFAVDVKELGVASWVYENEKKAGRFMDTLPAAEATYFPLSGPRYLLGVVGVKFTGKKLLTLDQENLLQNFLSQLSSSIEREQLNEITKKAIVVAESERLYRTVFTSISHELRTPITAIISASEEIEGGSSRDLDAELVGEVHTAALRLHHLVENLLDMSRLESGLIQPRLSWCDVQDLIQTVIRKTEPDLLNHRVVFSIPANFPLLKIDFALVEQALTNILKNAAVYTPGSSTIEITAAIANGICIIGIADNGPGLPREAIPRLFDKFYRVPGSPSGGLGLGLSIARGFVEAHKGSIAAEDSPTGGAQFTIRLPASEQPDLPTATDEQ